MFFDDIREDIRLIKEAIGFRSETGIFFNGLTLGRSEQIIELRGKIDALSKELGYNIRKETGTRYIAKKTNRKEK